MENRAAFQQLSWRYSENLIGNIIEGILLVHKDQHIRYTLSKEAGKVYERIIDKLNDQFNLKYTSSSQIPESQPDLNNNEKSELSVHTKGIGPEYVRHAEDISDVSYSQGETFSSTLLGDGKGQTYTLGKPKLPVRVKVIQSLIRTSGKVVNVCTIVKNIRDRTTEIIKGN